MDTLDLAKDRDSSGATQTVMGFRTEENTARVEQQQDAKITVVLGNPPYNVGQINFNDDNRNRTYRVVEDRVKKTYIKDSHATSVSKLNDPYVKFLRWATDRISEEGVVCFVTNNSFVHQIAFDGMRSRLSREFNRIYHVDLEGNVRINPSLAGSRYNVFGIQVGVGITIAVRNKSLPGHTVDYHRVEKTLPREKKLAWLARAGSASKVRWQRLKPDKQHNWLGVDNQEEFGSFVSLRTERSRSSSRTNLQCIFARYGLGVATHRDAVVYDFRFDAIEQRLKQFVDTYNTEVDRYQRAEKEGRTDDFVPSAGIVWDRDLRRDMTRGIVAEFSPEKLRGALYRPFTKKLLYFDRVLNAEVYSFPYFLPIATTEGDNRLIAVSTIGYRAQQFTALATKWVADLHLCATLDGHQCFPFYTYDEDGTNRRENVTDWALGHFREHFRDKKISKWDIFHYVYGVLHHPGYRERFAENLKRELPRIPLAPDFRAFAEAGCELARLHLDYEKLEPYELDWLETPGEPLSYRVEKMRLSKDKTSLAVNPSLTLAGIPPAVFGYRLGNRSALEWVVDQYRVKTDKRSGITSDPNRPDDPEYIVRLVGQVVRVSLETVRIVAGLPEDYGAGG